MGAVVGGAVDLDPMAKSLFARLPVPAEQSGGQAKSLTAALKNQATAPGSIKVLNKPKPVAQPKGRQEEDEDPRGVGNGPLSMAEKDKKLEVVDVKADDLVNRDEFYRRQLQHHSVSMFHRQLVTRNHTQGGEDAAEGQETLALRGKKRN